MTTTTASYRVEACAARVLSATILAVVTARKTILVLEDNDRRAELMRDALATVPGELEIRRWDNTRTMRAELAQWLPTACLISLDFDLGDSPSRNPGTGMDAVNMLLAHQPACPVIIHTSLPAESAMMGRALRQGGWVVGQVLFNRREAVNEWCDLVAELTAEREG